MAATAVSEPSAATTLQSRTGATPPQLSLGELIELVASVVPEEDVPDTVAALFDSGVASFARLLSRDERAALREAA